MNQVLSTWRQLEGRQTGFGRGVMNLLFLPAGMSWFEVAPSELMDLSILIGYSLWLEIVTEISKHVAGTLFL